MIKQLLTVCLAGCAFACTPEKVIEIQILNPGSLDRSRELAEIPAEAVAPLKDSTFILEDNQGLQIPYQYTYDRKIVFPVTIQAGQQLTYTMRAGTPDSFKTVTCGRQYPERLDDIAWENDRIAFRTYGPALQQSGEKAFGYDIWVKCISDPVVAMRYQTELDPETKEKIRELQKKDPKAARQLAEATSYHIDHGNGLDYYKVGPTLGAGTSALLVNDSICYPYCYESYQILENGPLRFTVQLSYHPLTLPGEEPVIENRIISLDAGSQLNRYTLTYRSLSRPTPVVTGIVTHAPSEAYQWDEAAGYLTYADPADAQNGQTYIGAVFPEPIDSARVVPFTPEEKHLRGATGHLLAYNTYQPGKPFTYYGGAGWSKWGFADNEAWVTYVKQFARKLKEPLQITVRCRK